MTYPHGQPENWEEALRGLLNGDFTYLRPVFAEDTAPGAPRCRIIEWYEAGRFAAEPQALAEALSCACFHGHTRIAEYFLERGVDPLAGNATGMNAYHWAANRGNLETVRMLLERNRARAAAVAAAQSAAPAETSPLEVENMYQGTVLGCAVWSAVYEPRPDHLAIIEALLETGANPHAADFPSSDARADALLHRYREARERTK